MQNAMQFYFNLHIEECRTYTNFHQCSFLLYELPALNLNPVPDVWFIFPCNKKYFTTLLPAIEKCVIIIQLCLDGELQIVENSDRDYDTSTGHVVEQVSNNYEPYSQTIFKINTG